MNKTSKLISLATAIVAITACGGADKMAKQAEQVTVKCTPEVLTLKGGNITADLAVTYPAKYFDAKAILEVTPVLVYEGGELAAEPLKYQGEKVKNNYKVVLSDGSTVSETVTFPYPEGMTRCHLELRAKCSTNNGSKWVDLPVKKVADGCNVTETLAPHKAFYEYKDHNYQEIITLTPEGKILYNINSAAVRNSELKGESIAFFKESLAEANANERKTLKGIEIVAYASPEGPVDKNNTLSDNRSKSAKNAFNKVVKKSQLNGIKADVTSAGEDWEGFQEMVSNSDITDKDLILRVLGMYEDSNVREKEIRNMSEVFNELKKDVLPELRRARFIATVQFNNYSEDELKTLMNENVDILDEDALLKAATLCSKADDKRAIYEKAVSKFNSARALFNLACVSVDEGDYAFARQQLEKCDQNDPDVINLNGVCYMKEGKRSKAEECFKKAGNELAGYNLALYALIDGDYATAAAGLPKEGADAAVANLMNGSFEDAAACLCDYDCPLCNYIRAICFARQNKADEAKAALEKAKADEALAKRAETDIEFINL